MGKFAKFIGYTVFTAGIVGIAAHLWLGRNDQEYPQNTANGRIEVTTTNHRTLTDPLNVEPMNDIRYIPNDGSGVYTLADNDADGIIDMPVTKTKKGMKYTAFGVEVTVSPVDFDKSDIDTIQANYTQIYNTIEKFVK